MKSCGVKVIPIESIKAASAAVKYSVVNQLKDAGDFKAMPVNNTVQTGKRVVATSATLTYVSKTFFPKLFSGSGSGSGTSATSTASYERQNGK